MSSSFGRIALSSELKNVWHHKFKTCMKYLMPTHICAYVHFLAEFKSSVKIFVGGTGEFLIKVQYKNRDHRRKIWQYLFYSIWHGRFYSPAPKCYVIKNNACLRIIVDLSILETFVVMANTWLTNERHTRHYSCIFLLGFRNSFTLQLTIPYGTVRERH